MKITKYAKGLKFTYIYTVLLVMFVGILALVDYPQYVPTEIVNGTIYHMVINGQEVGTVKDIEQAQQWLWEARKEVASRSEELVFLDVTTEFISEEVAWGIADEQQTVKNKIFQLLQGSVIETMQRSYTVKVNEYMANLSSADEVKLLLEAAIGKYDTEDAFDIELVQDEVRELSVLNALVAGKIVEEEPETDGFITGGIGEQIEKMFAAYEPEKEPEFEDFKLGLSAIGFSEEIEIVEAYLPMNQMISLEQAIRELTMEQEQQQIYEVQSGDTLSEIALIVDIPMEDIVAMNDSLDSVNSTLHIGQELIITVPEPELSVVRHEVNYYEEIYDAEIIYVDNDEWFTTQTVVLQQPSAGFRKVVVDETYVNDSQTDRTILKEEVVLDAVAKIVERGTKIPPSYIKPLSGGRASSGFGPRKAPTAGASTYHKGQDWATPVGTPIYASCGGTVAKAGWGSGYGYVVYIDHPDGRQTRYAHLSKVLVKAGQSVKQGEKIALSGNTGITSGPHLHFEMLINGKQVNPLNYLD